MAVDQYLQNEVRQATLEVEQKKAMKMYERTKLQGAEEKTEDLIDISKCKGSEEYFAAVSHQIPISELYSLVKCCSNSEENDFCVILIKIENKEL